MPSSHMWAARLAAGLPAGVHTLAVWAIDEFGQQPVGHVVFEALSYQVCLCPLDGRVGHRGHDATEHNTLDGDDQLMRILMKLRGKTRKQRQVPIISWPYMKKAGVTVTPRRMPSSTSS